jgi:hypothetical protein
VKRIKWKSLIITCIVALAPMLIGIIFYNQLPDKIAFNIGGAVEGYAVKNFALFGIPIILTALQILVCLIIDFTKNEDEENSPLGEFVRWWLPIISIFIEVLLIEYPLKVRLDIRMYLCIILGILFIVTGIYFPKMSYESAKGKIVPLPKNEKNFEKLTKVLAVTFIIFGILIIISIKFIPSVSVILLVVAAIVSSVENIIFGLQKEKTEDKN